jgi:hypothetical protein
VSVRREHDWGFFLWMGAGFLFAFGWLAQFTIGLPFLFLAVGALVSLAHRGQGWPEILGLIAGAGVVCLVIALINAIAGDLSPTIWALVGAALVGASAGAFWWLRCRPAVR